MIELKGEAPSGAFSIWVGPYIEFEHASKILLDYPELITNIHNYTISQVYIGYVYEGYTKQNIENKLANFEILLIRATEVYK